MTDPHTTPRATPERTIATRDSGARRGLGCGGRLAHRSRELRPPAPTARGVARTRRVVSTGCPNDAHSAAAAWRSPRSRWGATSSAGAPTRRPPSRSSTPTWRGAATSSTRPTSTRPGRRQHGGESEAILGRWLAGRDDRDDVVVVTKIGMPAGPAEGLTRDRSGGAPRPPCAARDRPDRPLLRPHGRRRHADRGDRSRLRRAGRRGHGAPHRRVQLHDGAPRGGADAEPERTGLARPSRASSRTSTSSTATTSRRRSRALRDNDLGVASRTSRGASGFLTGKYRRDAPRPETPRAAGRGQRLHPRPGLRGPRRA